jgi:hypothetical protein
MRAQSAIQKCSSAATFVRRLVAMTYLRNQVMLTNVFAKPVTQRASQSGCAD